MSTLPAWARRRLKEELDAVLNGCAFDPKVAARLRPFFAPRKKNEKQKATQKRKLGGAQAARARSAGFTAEAMARKGPECELGDHRAFLDMMVVHHLRAGSARRKLEAVHNMIRACRFHHSQWHDLGPAAFIENVKAWCARHGYPLPSIIRKAEASAQLPGRAAR